MMQPYVDTVLAPYISTQLQKNCRIYLVWDVYLPDSLKGATREKRGTRTRKQVSPSAVMPKNWIEFLHIDENITVCLLVGRCSSPDQKAMAKNCIQPVDVMPSALLKD